MSQEEEKLVERIAREVIRRLKELHPEAFIERPAAEPAPPKRVLILMTGGSIGFNPAIEELMRLRALVDGVVYSLVMSRSASRIFNPIEVRDRLGAVEMALEGETGSGVNPGRLLRQADLLAVPVLTRHTAARTAALLNDTLAVEMILDGLLMGKPVVAVGNAADPAAPEWEKLGLHRGGPGLIKAYQANLKCLKGFGIEIVPAERLALTIAGRLSGGPDAVRCERSETVSQPSTGARGGQRQVLTRSDVLNLSRRGGVLCLPRGTVLTSLAADTVREMGITVNEE